MDSCASTTSSNQQQLSSSSSSTEPSLLQKHVMFFDLDKDGVIYPSETYRGLRAIGASVLLSASVTFIIHLGFSARTRPGKPPSLRFPVEIKNIKKAKHGSDSDVYDSEGRYVWLECKMMQSCKFLSRIFRFVPEKFEEIFAKHAKTHKNALTWKEVEELIKHNREPKDYLGWLAGFIEWKVLFNLAKDKNDLLQKETVRSMYDGTLFEVLEKQNKSSKKL
ncbi:Probable peroxygenase 4 [Linum grandiflorum]